MAFHTVQYFSVKQADEQGKAKKAKKLKQD